MRYTALLPALLAVAGLLTACEYGEVHDPWVSGNQYQQERQRSAEVADELRHRVLYNQIDR
jgi:hypothetical protein